MTNLSFPKISQINLIVFINPILCNIYTFSSYDKSILNNFLVEYDFETILILLNLFINSSTNSFLTSSNRLFNSFGY